MVASSTAPMGHQSQLGTKNETTYGTAVTVDERFVFVSESIQKRGVILERDGIRGTRSHVSDDTRTGPYSVGGTIVLEPTPEDLAIWLPRILGAAAVGNLYDLAETLPAFTTVIDRVTKVFTYAGCVVSRAVFSGQKGGMLRLAMDIVAQSEAVGAAGTFPALSAGVTTPFIFNGDITLTLQAVSRKVDSWEMTIDNQVVADRFFNDLTIIDAPPGDRIITLSTAHSYNSTNSDLYGQALAGAAGTLALATGNYSLSAAFGKLQVPDQSPTVPSRAEIMLALDMVARKTGSTAELAITLDSNPA